MSLPGAAPLEVLSSGEPWETVGALVSELARLRAEAEAQRATIDGGTGGARGRRSRRRRRGAKRDRDAVTAEVVVKAAPPPGSRFKGYQDTLVRELRLSAEVVRFRRGRLPAPP